MLKSQERVREKHILRSGRSASLPSLFFRVRRGELAHTAVEAFQPAVELELYL